MAEQRYVSWPNFHEHYVEPGVPAEMVVDGTPAVRIEVADRRSSLTLMVASTGGPVPPSPLANVEIARAMRSAASWLSVRVVDPALFRPFYDLCLEVADRVQVEGEAGEAAVVCALDTLRALLEPKPVLSPERQLGLAGELWLLRRMATRHGYGAALDAWVGPDDDPQDFRIGGHEIEVKTTEAAERIHRFSGAQQLRASSGHVLWLLSLQAAPGGDSDDSFSLASVVEDIRVDLAGNVVLRGRLRSALDAYGYKDRDAGLYTTRYVWRTPALLIPVDDHFPAITNDMIRAMLGAPHAARLRGARFDLLLEGMGHLDGTPEFLAVLPPEPTR